MVIPDIFLKKWAALKAVGDMREIVEESGISYHKIKRAFDGKDTTEDVFVAIADFYEKRHKLLKSYI